MSNDTTDHTHTLTAIEALTRYAYQYDGGRYRLVEDASGQWLSRPVVLMALADAQPEQPKPIDMVLHCPKCGLQHIDRRDPPLSEDWDDAEAWTNPPHRSHLCRTEDNGCGHIWRPADVPTNGVSAVKTAGSADSPIPDQKRAKDALAIGADLVHGAEPQSFQARVMPWLLACFGAEIAADQVERNHRFLEEALELVQACECTRDEAHQLVDYVFDRPVGEKSQEVGGVMVTLAALCLAHGLDMHVDGETELARIWTKVDVIRAKQAAKPKHSPLPSAVTSPADTHAKVERERIVKRLREVADFECGCEEDASLTRENADIIEREGRGPAEGAPGSAQRLMADVDSMKAAMTAQMRRDSGREALEGARAEPANEGVVARTAQAPSIPTE